LRAPLAVADIDKNEAAQIAPGMDPARQGNRLPDLRRAQLIAMMRAFHEFKLAVSPRGFTRHQRNEESF